MADESPRFRLPFILPGQAQKELFHNEALIRIDAVLHPVVEEAPLNDPPPSPQEGQCWIVGASPTGLWAGQEGSLALWTEGGWRFVSPVAGTVAWNRSSQLPLLFDGNLWRGGEMLCSALHVDGQKVVGPRQPGVPSPSGGTVIDAEARTAIAALTAALMSHGLIG